MPARDPQYKAIERFHHQKKVLTSIALSALVLAAAIMAALAVFPIGAFAWLLWSAALVLILGGGVAEVAAIRARMRRDSAPIDAGLAKYRGPWPFDNIDCFRHAWRTDE